MRAYRRVETGLLLLVAALAVRIAAYALPYLWSAMLSAVPVGAPLSLELHVVWIPASAGITVVALAVLALEGFLLIWNGRWELGPDFASHVGMATLVLLVAAFAFVIQTSLGLLLGLSYLPDLRPWLFVLQLAEALFVGLALYGLFAGLPLPGARLAPIVPFVVGVAGEALVVAFSLSRATVGEFAGASGAALAFVSVVLWFALYLVGLEDLRLGGALRPPTAAIADH